MKLFNTEKKCKDKDLIWHMMGEMVKKYGSRRVTKNSTWQGRFLKVRALR